MDKTLAVQVRVRRLPLSRAPARALAHLSRYDLITFTSKHAEAFFLRELRERRLARPPRGRMVRVGPRDDLLKLAVSNKHILFPRSAIAPSDIVRRLRARGASVRIVPLYTTEGVPLSKNRKMALAKGFYTRLTFRSPSGVHGLMVQLSKKERVMARRIPVQCIGPTTARAARKAGFKRVSVKNV
jgi:uroporphyrinogen-III synthase